MLQLALACAGPAEDSSPPDGEGLLPLHADGIRLVDPDGNEVRLRGVNLGAWMFHETWITAVDYPTRGRFWVSAVEAGWEAEATAALRETGETDDLDTLEAALASRVGAGAAAAVRATTETRPSVYDDSDLPLRLRLEARFGTTGRDALLDTCQGAWITGDDVAAIAALGFNLVRVPIGYRGLTTGSDAAPLTGLAWNEAAFARLDALLDACAAHGVYAVLDLQESPGGHNDYSGPATLYDDPAMQALTIHDGFMGMWELPVPADVGWTGVVYSTHLFEWGASSQDDYAALIELYRAGFSNAQARQQVPYFIGSFSTMEDADWAYASAEDLVTFYDEMGWSWAWWTWKRIDDPLATTLWGTRTGWGLGRDAWAGFERPDVHLDDEATLAAKLAAYDGALAPNEALIDAIAPAR